MCSHSIWKPHGIQPQQHHMHVFFTDFIVRSYSRLFLNVTLKYSLVKMTFLLPNKKKIQTVSYRTKTMWLWLLLSFRLSALFYGSGSHLFSGDLFAVNFVLSRGVFTYSRGCAVHTGEAVLVSLNLRTEGRLSNDCTRALHWLETPLVLTGLSPSKTI